MLMSTVAVSCRTLVVRLQLLQRLFDDRRKLQYFTKNCTNSEIAHRFQKKLSSSRSKTTLKNYLSLYVAMKSNG